MKIIRLFAVNLIIAIAFAMSAMGAPAVSDTAQYRPLIQTLVDSIAAGGSHNTSQGDGAPLSVQWYWYEDLLQKATDGELVSLTDHPSAAVRCYAFDALIERKHPSAIQILLNHLSDSAEIFVSEGCLASTETVGDYFIFVGTWRSDLLPRRNPNLSMFPDTTDRERTLDSLLLFGKSIHIGAKDALLEDIHPKPKYYKRIREIATTEHNPIAMVALARYQRQSDVKTIKEILAYGNTQPIARSGSMQALETSDSVHLWPGHYYTWEYYDALAIRTFPDPAFYPYLVESFEREYRKQSYYNQLWCVLYEALAKYPTPQTLKLFERVLNYDEWYRPRDSSIWNIQIRVGILVAVKKYPHPIFEPLQQIIKLDLPERLEVDRRVASPYP